MTTTSAALAAYSRFTAPSATADERAAAFQAAAFRAVWPRLGAGLPDRERRLLHPPDRRAPRPPPAMALLPPPAPVPRPVGHCRRAGRRVPGGGVPGRLAPARRGPARPRAAAAQPAVRADRRPRADDVRHRPADTVARGGTAPHRAGGVPAVRPYRRL